MILRNLDVASYTIIDPDESYPEYIGDTMEPNLREELGDAVMVATRQRLERFGPVTFIRAFSNDPEVLSLLQDRHFDLVFVDGNHAYEYVLEDLRNFRPLVSNAGVLVGDDFFMRSRPSSSSKTGEGWVYEAVCHFAEESKLSWLEFGLARESGDPKLFMFVKPDSIHDQFT